jgi:membrane protein
MLMGAIVTAPFIALGPRKIAEYIPDSWDNVLQFGYYPVLFLGLVVAVSLLYRVSLPKPLPSHRVVIGSVLATVVFLVATYGLRLYLTWITSTGYTYGALATPIAFLLFAFFLGFAIMLGAELNAAIQEEWPAPATHAKRFRWWLEEKAESLNESSPAGDAALGRRAESTDEPLGRRAESTDAPAAATSKADGATS